MIIFEFMKILNVKTQHPPVHELFFFYKLVAVKHLLFHIHTLKNTLGCISTMKLHVLQFFESACVLKDRSEEFNIGT